MKILFCNVGWMNEYVGIDGDSIDGGGAFNEENVGHEVCNFSSVQGRVYGYVESKGQIKIERLGVDKKVESISGVTVVWTAPRKSGGTVVVGWYRNATVYRQLQQMPESAKRHKKNGVSHYRITTLFNDATLLSPDERVCVIPRRKKGFMGQRNVWYPYSEESKEFVADVAALIEGKRLGDWRDVDADLTGKEGNPRFVLHLSRERDQKLVKAKKKDALRKTGKLSCEVCGFDFAEVYAEVGEGFCEVHHITPLAEADGEVETKLEDLAIVCSNCHRMLHRGKPTYSIDKLKSILRHKKGRVVNS